VPSSRPTSRGVAPREKKRTPWVRADASPPRRASSRMLADWPYVAAMCSGVHPSWHVLDTSAFRSRHQRPDAAHAVEACRDVQGTPAVFEARGGDVCAQFAHQDADALSHSEAGRDVQRRPPPVALRNRGFRVHFCAERTQHVCVSVSCGNVGGSPPVQVLDEEPSSPLAAVDTAFWGLIEEAQEDSHLGVAVPRRNVDWRGPARVTQPAHLIRVGARIKDVALAVLLAVLLEVLVIIIIIETQQQPCASNVSASRSRM
jgi:hypothetical protein